MSVDLNLSLAYKNLEALLRWHLLIYLHVIHFGLFRFTIFTILIAEAS